MTITVCVPAYRAGRFLAATLASALAQTHVDLRVDVGVDPCDSDGTGDADDTLRALAPFRADPRVRVHANAQRLGWDGNVRALLRRVDTPWFAILPHDDLWHPHYLERLLADLRDDDAAVVAYADLVTFGNGEPARKGVALPRGSRRAQLLAFLLQGAEAMPWRGVTRAALRDRVGDFPVDGHRGFAVECEYVLALLLAGAARHRPEVLYSKRVHPDAVASASRERLRVPLADRASAWQAHAGRMAALLDAGLSGPEARADAGAIPDALLRAALAAAMWRRHQLAVAPELDAAAQREAGAWLVDLARSPARASGAVRARLHTVLGRHAAATGEDAHALVQSRLAGVADPGYPEAWLLQAERLAATDRVTDALACCARAETLAPGMAEAQALRALLQSRLGA